MAGCPSRDSDGGQGPDQSADQGYAKGSAISSAGPTVRTLHVPDTAHGRRLDQVLHAAMGECSRNYLQQLIEAGAVRINGAIVTRPAHKVRALDEAAVELRPTPQSQSFTAEHAALDLVYEDEHLLVVHKPAGWVVHPAPGHWGGTLMNALLGYDERAFDLPRAGIVHRLDQDTSGLMVVARTRYAMDALVLAIAERRVHRQYIALAHGAWTGPARRRVDAAIGRDPRHRLRMAVLDAKRPGAKPAQTDIVALGSVAQGCLVRCTLHTGRTHQIRVHMASIGHPLVADSLYGGAPAAGMTRQALHADKLAFHHPITATPLAFHIPWPQDMVHAIEIWGLPYNDSAQIVH
ncbi:RluA family pseudouridine synthase [Candidatus Symbiobacter mobilis]|uniref:RluA family pseudouridine synthase n=1 Tax=Candidatus Symbiobacter mobilis TaxID=1436290 RepID=UPI00059DDD96